MRVKSATVITKFQFLSLGNQTPILHLMNLVANQMMSGCCKEKKNVLPVRSLTPVTLLSSLQPFTTPTELSRLIMMIMINDSADDNGSLVIKFQNQIFILNFYFFFKK
jgi:hypothetical protein